LQTLYKRGLKIIRFLEFGQNCFSAFGYLRPSLDRTHILI
jgi:hypothetical protein